MSSGSFRHRLSARVAAAVLAAVLAAVVAVPASAVAAGWRVVDLGAGDGSAAHAVNDRGHIVGDHAGGTFLWRDGTLVDLGTGPGSSAADVNNRDEVVGTRHGRAFLWRDGTVVDLGTLPGGTFSTAQAINDRGEVVGYSAVGDFDIHAFRWRDGVLHDLGAAYEFRSQATDINNRGQIVGGIDLGPAFAETPVRWWHETVTELHAPRGTAVAVNAFGAVTGIHWGARGTAGFVWRHGEFVELPAPPPTPSGWTFLQPYGINDLTQVVGASSVGAFVWDRGHTTVLPNLVGTSTAYDVDNRGVVVGSSAARADGLNQHAVYWTTGPTR